MLTSPRKLLLLLRDRWRWVRGRCPRCNRNLYATFSYYLTHDPECPVCKDQTGTDLRMWHTHRAFRTTKESDVAGVKE
ncbi:MAG TPA: hypothetical protein VKU02_08020 [Gemmataceae bacterium]|nr:hypothetical protein [Gemmataceae bacterium]